MPEVTLIGQIPVYVVVDTENNQVRKVVADDENFTYISKHTQLPVTHENYPETPEGVDAEGAPIDDTDLLDKALRIAQGEAPEIPEGELIDWPGWSWGW